MMSLFLSTLLPLALGTTYYSTSSISGKSTFYGGNPSGGACGFATVPTASFPFGFYAATGGATFNGGYGCGACYQITCIGPYTENPECHCDPNTPSVIISAMDQCPECSDTHFDLDPTAMERIVADGLAGVCGVIETTIKRVSCDYVTNIKIRAKEGTNPYWYGLHIDNVAGYGTVQSVKIKSSGSSSYATTCTKSGGPSYWLCSGGYPLVTPLSVQLTNENSDTISCDGCITNFNAGAEFDFGSNFGGSSPTPSTKCEFIPESCRGDLMWAITDGIHSNPEWYDGFEAKTGVSLSQASVDDMARYWSCTGQNPNGNCNGIQCGSCSLSSALSAVASAVSSSSVDGCQDECSSKYASYIASMKAESQSWTKERTIAYLKTEFTASPLSSCIISLGIGSRPDPTCYLSQTVIDYHLSDYRESGASFVATTRYWKRYGEFERIGYGPSDDWPDYPNGNQFVSPHNEQVALLNRCKDERDAGLCVLNGLGIPDDDGDNMFDKDWREIEPTCKIGDCDINRVMQVTVPPENLEALHLRMASGNEPGTNSEWIPGGYTSGGVSEAVVYMFNDGQYCVNPVATMDGDFCFGQCPIQCDGHEKCRANNCDIQCREQKCTGYGGFACNAPGAESAIYYSCSFESPAQPRQCFYGDTEALPYSGFCVYYRVPVEDSFNLMISQQFVPPKENFKDRIKGIKGLPSISSTMSEKNDLLKVAEQVSSGNNEYIVVNNYESTQEWYLTFTLTNIDASSCGDSIADVQVLRNNVWVSYDQYYDEGAKGDRYAFNNNGISFLSMLPISVKITMTSTREITLWGIITDLTTTSVFTTSELICDGTRSPTAPTLQPTVRPSPSPTAPTTPYPTAESVCIDEGSLDWRSYNNQIYLNGNKFNMKGLSWFGFETALYDLHGLNVHPRDWYLDWMVSHGFNAVRLPFSQDFMTSSDENRQKYLDAVRAAGERGILVMADFHSKTADSFQDGLNSIDQSEAIGVWEMVTDLLKDEYNVFLADIFNEPHDVNNAEWPQWIQYCEDAASAIWAKGVNWMVAVEGTNWECTGGISCAWGENLEGVRNTGVTFDLATYGENRFVWSPHVYGGDVTNNYAYTDAAWKAHWGYLVDGTHATNEAASLIGEFGTKYEGGMVEWLDDLIDYLIEIEQRNTFYWSLNPDSGDTGGLLQNDWTTDESGKLSALDRLQPNPSKIEYDSARGQVCVSFEGGQVASDPTFKAMSEKNDLLKVAEQEPQSGLDLIFILDSSGSVAFNDDKFLNWQAEIDYVSTTVRNWDPARTALINFSGCGPAVSFEECQKQNKLKLEWGLTDYSTNDEVLARLDLMGRDDFNYGFTWTNEAFTIALEEFGANSSQDRNKIIILVTDGEPYPYNEGHEPCRSSTNYISETIIGLRQLNVETMTLGINTSPDQMKEYFRCMDVVYNVDGFDLLSSREKWEKIEMEWQK